MESFFSMGEALRILSRRVTSVSHLGNKMRRMSQNNGDFFGFNAELFWKQKFISVNGIRKEGWNWCLSLGWLSTEP